VAGPSAGSPAAGSGRARRGIRAGPPPQQPDWSAPHAAVGCWSRLLLLLLPLLLLLLALLGRASPLMLPRPAWLTLLAAGAELRQPDEGSP
jgi:hypothetical protein